MPPIEPFPQWLVDYTAWHRAHRNSPDARFIMYSCHQKMNGAMGNICGGHGNRFKQIGWTLRVAAVNRLVLLVDWVSPENLEDFLEPAEVDWRPNAEERKLLASENHPHVWRMGWPSKNTVPPPPSKYVRITAGGEHGAACYNCTDHVASFVTLYRYLFRAAPAFKQQVHAARAQLFGPGVRYNSMHIRMGDSAEGTKLKATSQFYSDIKDARCSLAQAAVAVACVASAAPGHPLFVATDNAALKAALLAREPALLNATALVGARAFRRVVVTGCTDCMVNAVQRHSLDPEGVKAIFVDVALLAGAQDFVRMGQLSNYATWAEGWRGASMQAPYSFFFPSRYNERQGRAKCTDWLGTTARGARLLNQSNAAAGFLRGGV